MYRLRIESCENADEGFTFDHESLAGVISTAVNELVGEMPDNTLIGAATLLDTIVEAMKRHDEGNAPIARHWDFSSPESAYYVVFWEDAEDDDGTACEKIWIDSGEASLDAAVRDIVSPGWKKLS